ncbi:MAG: GNAT family N-acetyltransferase [Burkholderiales bacterium]|jgi:GNAT superfamily N-acetyltransferase|nr:GNAT family N-acetyltransferase [Burkholderiales bacterium]
MDMLIKLYESAGNWATGDDRSHPEIVLRKPRGSEHTLLERWVEDCIAPIWLSEVRAALTNRPVTLFIALRDTDILGFACYDATARGFIGPIGVVESARNQGIGSALLLACLQDMRSAGYGYAIAGHVGAPDFFRRVAGAIEIPDSTPGFYAGMLR